ncbi:hypothetical protein L873DRAFT_1733321 [Choiromyces venosus 120613-1]|uniref:Uncharacterized protein n=1 Tax=Choiromyces venosus 120613-1 TaxID=1336337 RepID=A0A3N4JVP3_9PEZI|nr:hypothetical protein L873DRAFT_1733321 [Choiromyces venosus 120613-1]
MSNPIYAYREYLHLLPHLFFVKVEKQAPDEACIACDDTLPRHLFECNTCTLRLCEPCRDRIVDGYHMGSLTRLIQTVASWKLRYQSPIGAQQQQQLQQQQQQQIGGVGGGGVDMNRQTVIMMMQAEHGQQRLHHHQHQHQQQQQDQLQIHHHHHQQQQQEELQRIQQQQEEEEQQMMLQMDSGLRTQRKFLEMMQKIQSEIEMEAEMENMNNNMRRGRGGSS